MNSTAELAARQDAAPTADQTRPARRNRIAALIITGALLIVATGGIIATSLQAHPLPTTSYSNVQLPTE